jgi:RsmE family RNA methyltransferase
MQSRRPLLPRIGDSESVEEIATRAAPGAIALAEPGGGAVSLSTPVVLVGPEGGWSPRELALVRNKVGLGDGVLRVETAAVAAGVLLSALRATAVLPVA